MAENDQPTGHADKEINAIDEETRTRLAEYLNVDRCHVDALCDELEDCDGEVIESLMAERQLIEVPDDSDCTDPCKIYEPVHLGGMLSRRFIRRVDPAALGNLSDLVVACSLVPLRLHDCADLVLDADLCSKELAERVYRVSAATLTIRSTYREQDMISSALQKVVADGVSGVVEGCLAGDAAASFEALLRSFQQRWSASLAVRLGQTSRVQAMLLDLFDDDSLALELQPGCNPDGVVTVLGWCHERLGVTLDVSSALRGTAALPRLVRAASCFLWPRTPELTRRWARAHAMVAQQAPIVSRRPAPAPPADEPQRVFTVVKEGSVRQQAQQVS